MCRTYIIALLLCLFPCGVQLQAQENNYGVDQANAKFFLSNGTLGGEEDFDCMSLSDHPDVSGVPLGGIGAGNVNLSPSGSFTRIGINNIHMPIRRSEGSFFALWTKQGGKSQAVRLVRDSTLAYTLPGLDHSQYTGLFPTAELRFAHNQLPVTPVIRAYSGLVPHNLTDSSLPVAWFEIELSSDYDTEVSVAFAWEDFIGLFRDPDNLDGMDFGQLLEGNRSQLANGEEWKLREKAATCVRDFSASQWRGLVQYATEPLQPRKMTFQNYVNRVLVAVEQGKDLQVSCLPSFDTEAAEGWKTFKESGRFSSERATDTSLSLQAGKSRSSALAVSTTLKAGKTMTLRFMLAWWAPEIQINRAKAPKGSYWPFGADYNKFYHNSFASLEDLVSYAIAQRERIYKQSTEWHEPILKSTLPDWYKFKLINSGYVIYTNLILNKKGDMMSNEGAMGGFGGTMDQRICSHPFYQKFFTQLDRSEMNIFAHAMDPDGYILHFIGHYYVGMGTVGGRVPTEKGYMLDNSSGWIIQLIKDYEQTGDMDYLSPHVEKVKQAMNFLCGCRPEGCRIPVGATTYDDFSHPPLYSYYAGVWLTTLKAYEAVGKAIGDQEMIDFAQKEFELSQKEAIDKLWNGRFFAYGSEPDGSKRLDNVLFTGQLAGQFLSRYCGWGDVYPLDIVKSSLVSQFTISLAQTPDYYANKVWDLTLGRGIDNRGSQCWPFYLESYTALTGMQAGYYADAMDIMRHIQLVHLRKGWTWTQNLWNPGEITYMTAPVTWFSTDVLAGAGVNLPQAELRLSPIVGPEKTVLPLYYPTFWATLTADPATKKLTFQVTKTFGQAIGTIDKIVSEPAGVATSQRRVTPIAPFSLKAGNTLDLSKYWDVIVNSQIESPVLPQAVNSYKH